jgi:hypothetical protein
MADDESAVCEHTGAKLGSSEPFSTEEKWLAFAKQTRCCHVAAFVIKRGNRKTQCWIKVQVNILHTNIHYVGHMNKQI